MITPAVARHIEKAWRRCSGTNSVLLLALFAVGLGLGKVGRSEVAGLSGDTDHSHVNYQWRPTRQLVALKTKTKISHRGANGLALDTNGDWLLLTPAGIVVGDESRDGGVIWRSSDRGRSWSKAAVIRDDLPDVRHLPLQGKNYSHDYRQLHVTAQGRFLIYAGHWPADGGSVRVPHTQQGTRLDEDPPGRPRVAMAN